MTYVREDDIAEDVDALFWRWLHRDKFYKDGRGPRPNAFTDYKGGMSVDWNKYSTASQTLSRAAEDSGVIRVPARGIATITPPQTIVHDPVCGNQSHTNIVGSKDDLETRKQFQRISVIEIQLQSRVSPGTT